MPEINPVTKDQLFEKKIAENTGSNYNVGDISDVVPVTKDQALLKEIALNSAGQSGDITELEGKVTANTSAIEAMVNVTGACNLANNDATTKTDSGVLFTVNSDNSVTVQRQSPTTDPYSYIKLFDNKTLPAVKMIVSGCPNVTGLTLYLYDKTTSTRYNQTGDAIEVTPDASHTYSLVIEALNSADLDTAVTVYPMLYDARLTPTGYVPYAMTNRELTEICSDIPSHLFVDKNDSIISDFDNLPYGFYCGNVDNTSNHCPDVNGSAFLIFTVGGNKTYNFKIQLAVSYATNKSYIRYCWVTWSDWQQISN